MTINELLDKPVWQMTGEELLFLAQHGNNVSSMNSEQRKLCVQSPIEIDARFLRKQAIGCNGT